MALRNRTLAYVLGPVLVACGSSTTGNGVTSDGGSGGSASSSGGTASSSGGSTASSSGSTGSSSGTNATSSGGSTSSGATSSGGTSSGGFTDAGPPPPPPDAGSGPYVLETSRNAGAGTMPEHMALVSPPTPGTPTAGMTTIVVDSTAKRQTIQGFGAALTESVAYVINSLPAAQQTDVINALFAPPAAGGSGYTLTRTHVGSCDMAMTQYSLDDTCGGPSATPPPPPAGGGGSSTTRGACMTADPNLSMFSIAHDTTPTAGVQGSGLLVPLLKSALSASNGALNVLSSTWSAPAWMKTNYLQQGVGGQDGSLAMQYYPQFASYLSKYVSAYKAAGVPIWALTPTNEPLGVGASRESMAWSPANMNTFIKNNLGPQLAKDGNGNVKIFIYDHNKGPAGSDVYTWANMMLTDPATKPFVAGTAVHWYGSTVQTDDDAMDQVHAIDPTKSILFDEGTADELGDTAFGKWSTAFAYTWLADDYYWKKDDKDWGFWFASSSCATPATCNHPPYEAFYRYARDIIHGLNHWYVGWIDWTAVLNQDGGPEHVYNPIPTTIMVDQRQSPPVVYKSPTYYLLKSFSAYIRPGATVLGTNVTVGSSVSATDYDNTPTYDGGSIMATSAQNVDGSTVVEVFNETGKAIPYGLTVAGKTYTYSIPAQSLQTIVVP